MPRQLCSISVDLDPLRCYYAIHGLGEPPRPLRDVVLRRGLPRFLELFARRRIAATFFVVGEDLVPGTPSGTPAGRALLQQAHCAGHELGSHSHSHPYELSRLDRAAVETEVDAAHAAIAEATTMPPVGFRSPGYNLSPTVMQVLAARRYLYDSSVLPAPLYYGAKAVVMAAMALARRPSGSTLGDPRLLLAPRDPYRPSIRAPWRRGDAPLVELPIAVTPGLLRVPLLGMTVLSMPPRVRAFLLDAIRGEPFLNFELHGIDLVGVDEDSIPVELVRRQPDLRVPLAERTRTLEATLDRLAADFDFLPLRDAARALA